eukprot:TRINITY_DN67608_c1_g1_i17.p2 TRINITY_DN67608_c1_g1~~TRINITY_DN67608_c1_g1_i17.p2  ORF type:complete len:117 (+),score=9.86 TRINITY_DN67608_c1_g1_i17:643-993(+)
MTSTTESWSPATCSYNPGTGAIQGDFDGTILNTNVAQASCHTIFWPGATWIVVRNGYCGPKWVMATNGHWECPGYHWGAVCAFVCDFGTLDGGLDGNSVCGLDGKWSADHFTHSCS